MTEKITLRFIIFVIVLGLIVNFAIVLATAPKHKNNSSGKSSSDLSNFSSFENESINSLDVKLEEMQYIIDNIDLSRFGIYK